MKNKVVLLFGLLFLFSHCRKVEQQPVNIDCDSFATVLIADDYDNIAKQVNAFFAGRKPSPNLGDEFGYEAIYDSWINQIDACPDLKVLGSCYECFQTYPLTSYVKIEINYNGQTYTRSIYTSYNLNLNYYGQ